MCSVDNQIQFHIFDLVDTTKTQSERFQLLDKYFENVCELDIMFNIEKAHFIIDEMVMNGMICETNKGNILNPVVAIVKSAGM